VIYEGQGAHNDITELLALEDRVPPTSRHGELRPKALLANRAYDIPFTAGRSEQARPQHRCQETGLGYMDVAWPTNNAIARRFLCCAQKFLDARTVLLGA
jgi:hypothetical protein